MSALTTILESGWPAKGVVVLLLASLVCLALRRASAAARHAVWAAALTGILALPMLSAIVPALELPAAFAPQSREQAAAVTPVAPAGELLLAFAPSPTEPATTDLPATFEAAPPPIPSASPLHWTDYVRGLWFTGAAVLIVLYRDENRHAWAKKIQIKGFIRDKEYRMVKEGSRVDRVILGESNQLVRLRYAPHKRQRLKEDVFDLRELEFSGLAARGRKMGSKPVAGVSLEQPA